MELQELFSNYVTQHKRFEELKKDFLKRQDENPLNIKHTRTLQLEEAQAVIDKKLEYKKKDEEFKSAKKEFQASEKGLLKALAIVGNKVNIPLDGALYGVNHFEGQIIYKAVI